MSEHAATAIHPRKRTPAGAAAEQGYGSLFEGNRQAFEHWLRAMMNMSQEILHFAQARLQEDVAAWTELASLRSFDEALRFQQLFAERAAKEYLEEFNRLSQIIAGMSTGTPMPPPPPQA